MTIQFFSQKKIGCDKWLLLYQNENFRKYSKQGCQRLYHAFLHQLLHQAQTVSAKI